MISTQVTVEAAPVVCRPVSSWTGPPPPLVEAELRAAHAIASAARGEFVPQFSQALWQATAHVMNCAQIKFRGAFVAPVEREQVLEKIEADLSLLNRRVDLYYAIDATPARSRGGARPDSLFDLQVNATTQNPSGAAVLRALEDFTFTAPQGALPGTSFVVRAPTGALIAATFPPGIGPGYNIYVHAPGAWGAIATSAVYIPSSLSGDPPPPHYQAPVALVTAAGVGEPAPVPGAPVQGWGA